LLGLTLDLSLSETLSLDLLNIFIVSFLASDQLVALNLSPVKTSPDKRKSSSPSKSSSNKRRKEVNDSPNRRLIFNDAEGKEETGEAQNRFNDGETSSSQRIDFGSIYEGNLERIKMIQTIYSNVYSQASVVSHNYAAERSEEIDNKLRLFYDEIVEKIGISTFPAIMNEIIFKEILSFFKAEWNDFVSLDFSAEVTEKDYNKHRKLLEIWNAYHSCYLSNWTKRASSFSSDVSSSSSFSIFIITFFSSKVHSSSKLFYQLLNFHLKYYLPLLMKEMEDLFEHFNDPSVYLAAKESQNQNPNYVDLLRKKCPFLFGISSLNADGSVSFDGFPWSISLFSSVFELERFILSVRDECFRCSQLNLGDTVKGPDDSYFRSKVSPFLKRVQKLKEVVHAICSSVSKKQSSINESRDDDVTRFALQVYQSLLCFLFSFYLSILRFHVKM
jgi:hypothetical protein